MNQHGSTAAMAILAIVVLHACVFSVGGWRDRIVQGCCTASHGTSRRSSALDHHGRSDLAETRNWWGEQLFAAQFMKTPLDIDAFQLSRCGPEN
jgi:hypothetical protein